ncbi:hypothetical protein [Methylobacterium goesingense]|uniref:Uncharacterized protein n=1 Tax=Methylobacterium goesingense TaxID=243690 RepID=A0ABV2L1L0_9HYPH|nr:hypothetical protein [Methylobacterium goesingense]GJD72615.1 hypothetical protein CFIICLFH_0833 [Methylobacterium goesingense]
MPLDVDGLALLKAIMAAPDAFPDIVGEAARAARALVIRQLKAKTLTLSGLRRMYECLGHEVFTLVADDLTEAEARTLVARFDPRHPDGMTAPPHWLRRQIVVLAGGAEPCAGGKTVRTPRPSAPAAAPVVRAIGSPAFTARWDGQDHDPPPRKDKSKAKGKA